MDHSVGGGSEDNAQFVASVDIVSNVTFPLIENSTKDLFPGALSLNIGKQP